VPLSCCDRIPHWQGVIVYSALTAVGRVTRATAAEPYLAIALEFNVSVMGAVMEELDEPPLPARWHLPPSRKHGIGDLAKRAGVSTSKIRFYEARGLLPPRHVVRTAIAITATTPWKL
jgi:MerR family regulatory protein/AraC-type transcriptional regulator N-terminus